jgi:3-isopropylmalate/(R)-2-methylmalate dehydratase large subunit
MGKTMSERPSQGRGRRGGHGRGHLWVAWTGMMDDIRAPASRSRSGIEGNQDEGLGRDKVASSPTTTLPGPAQQVQSSSSTANGPGPRHRPILRIAGPCHLVAWRKHGHVLPGTFVLGTIPTPAWEGMLGAFASGVGSTRCGLPAHRHDLLRVPETITDPWSGGCPRGGHARTSPLRPRDHFGTAGATLQAVIRRADHADLNLDRAHGHHNMPWSGGRWASWFRPGGGGIPAAIGASAGYTVFASDPDATFCHTTSTRPTGRPRACPHEGVTTSAPWRGQGHFASDQAYFGAATGGRYHDLEAAPDPQGPQDQGRRCMLVVAGLQSIWLLASAPASGDWWRPGHILGPDLRGPAWPMRTRGFWPTRRVASPPPTANFIGSDGEQEFGHLPGSPLTVAASARHADGHRPAGNSVTRRDMRIHSPEPAEIRRQHQHGHHLASPVIGADASGGRPVRHERRLVSETSPPGSSPGTSWWPAANFGSGSSRRPPPSP